MTKHRALMWGSFGKNLQGKEKKKRKGEYLLLILKLFMNGLKYHKQIPSHSNNFL